MKPRNYVAKHMRQFNRASIVPSKRHKKLSSTLACLEEEKLSEGCFMQDKEHVCLDKRLIDELDAREEG